jgi:hypothetical protein
VAGHRVELVVENELLIPSLAALGAPAGCRFGPAGGGSCGGAALATIVAVGILARAARLLAGLLLLWRPRVGTTDWVAPAEGGRGRRPVRLPPAAPVA